MNGQVYALVLAGGKGERLWPLSRENLPKQFLDVNGKSLFQLTLERVRELVPVEQTIVITRKSLEKLVLNHLNGEKIKVIFETVGKNTAPAIAIAAKWVFEKDQNGILLVLPSDHLIRDTKNFKKTIEIAIEVARLNYLVTIGISPTRPETGYGYIEVMKPLPDFEGAFVVRRFTEKPDLETAKKFVQSGRHFWNSGMFVYPVSQLLEEFKTHQPLIYQLLEEVDFSNPTTIDTFYQNVINISVDYAIMEKSRKIAMVVSQFDWEDLGSLESFRNILLEVDANFCRGNVVTVDSKNNILISENNSIIATYGVNNLIIVHTKDVTLVIPRDQAQNVKELLKKLRENPALLKHWVNRPS